MNFLIKTLGCRVNQAESQDLAEVLRAKGWRDVRPADLVILNTCCVTQKAEKETKQEARKLKRQYPKAFLIITGCAVNYWQMKVEVPNLGADLLVENEKKLEIPWFYIDKTRET